MVRENEQMNGVKDPGRQTGDTEHGGMGGLGAQGNRRHRAGPESLGPGAGPGRPLEPGALAAGDRTRAREGPGSGWGPAGLGEAQGSRGIARC